MARAETVTLLSLDRFFQIIGVDPLSANQLQSSLLPALECRTAIYQWNWASPAMAGREEYAQAIRQAEQDIAAYINYWPLPTFVQAEQRLTVRPADRTLVATGFGGGFGYSWNGPAVNVRGFPKSTQLRYGHYIAGGQKAKVLIEANAPITYTDTDGDGYKETATVVVATSVTDLCELHAYDPGEGGTDDWEIRPITVTAGPLLGEVTITCKREQCVDPSLWERINAGSAGPIDADVDANFLSELDVYQVYLDPSAPVQFLWQNLGCLQCGGSGCAACQDTTQLGCLNARDDRLSIVTYAPGDWDALTRTFTPTSYASWREPDKMKLWYYAGFQSDAVACPTLQLDPFWERTIAMLAMAYLQGMVCDCSAVKTFYNWAQEDLALNDGTSQRSFVLAQRALNCEWGTKRGAVEAFARCNQEGRRLPPPPTH